jgi:hypothetical protein
MSGPGTPKTIPPRKRARPTTRSAEVRCAVFECSSPFPGQGRPDPLSRTAFPITSHPGDAQMTASIKTTVVFLKPFQLPSFNETLPPGEYDVETQLLEPIDWIEPGTWTSSVLVHLHARSAHPGLTRTLSRASGRPGACGCEGQAHRQGPDGLFPRGDAGRPDDPSRDAGRRGGRVRIAQPLFVPTRRVARRPTGQARAGRVARPPPGNGCRTFHRGHAPGYGRMTVASRRPAPEPIATRVGVAGALR